MCWSLSNQPFATTASRRVLLDDLDRRALDSGGVRFRSRTSFSISASSIVYSPSAAMFASSEAERLALAALVGRELAPLRRTPRWSAATTCRPRPTARHGASRPTSRRPARRTAPPRPCSCSRCSSRPSRAAPRGARSRSRPSSGLYWSQRLSSADGDDVVGFRRLLGRRAELREVLARLRSWPLRSPRFA